MKITEETIPLIEKALGFELYEPQKEYLLDEDRYKLRSSGRNTGKTTAYCIRLALSEGEPLDLRKPWMFSDDWGVVSDTKQYARQFFRRFFMDIRDKLKESGFPVRKVLYGRRIKDIFNPPKMKYGDRILDLIDREIVEIRDSIINTKNTLATLEERRQVLYTERKNLLKSLYDDEMKLMAVEATPNPDLIIDEDKIRKLMEIEED